MLASDSSWSNIASISATLPGGFSSLWVNQEKTRIGNQLRRSDADNRAIGGTLNLNSLWSKLGTFSISYNDDRRYNSHYYTADYYQNVYSGPFGSLGLRAGIQRYNNGDSSANTGKYIALDLSLPLGNWFSAGMTHQNGYTMANLSARKQFDEGTIRTVGANLSRAISGDTGDDKTLSGGAYAQFDARYASGTLNVNSAADGYINTNLTANGSVGWQGKNIAASGRTDGNAGVIFDTGLENDGQISAKINGRIFPLNGKRNYLPLSPYGRYEVELQNSKNSLDSYDIVSGRKSHLTLYPGNVAVIEPEVKQMVTVSVVSVRKTAHCWLTHGLTTISAEPEPMKTASLSWTWIRNTPLSIFATVAIKPAKWHWNSTRRAVPSGSVMWSAAASHRGRR